MIYWLIVFFMQTHNINKFDMVSDFYLFFKIMIKILSGTFL